MTQESATILHIATRTSWRKALKEGVYRGDTLETEGFIHCSTSEQVLGPANALFKGHADLVLLRIDSAKLEARIAYEDLDDSGQSFPHIYGPLNISAVSRVVDFPPGADGTFSLPASLAD